MRLLYPTRRRGPRSPDEPEDGESVARAKAAHFVGVYGTHRHVRDDYAAPCELREEIVGVPVAGPQPVEIETRAGIA
jgi:hypothetical protein